MVTVDRLQLLSVCTSHRNTAVELSLLVTFHFSSNSKSTENRSSDRFPALSTFTNITFQYLRKYKRNIQILAYLNDVYWEGCYFFKQTLFVTIFQNAFINLYLQQVYMHIYYYPVLYPVFSWEHEKCDEVHKALIQREEGTDKKSRLSQLLNRLYKYTRVGICASFSNCFRCSFWEKN